MPWPRDHKSRTREKIVEAASAAFRGDGISAVRVHDVMAGAGLTHGGFYAHFDSKDDLLRAALEHASEQTIERLSKPLADLRGEDRLRTVIDSYLSPAHVAHPEAGCPLASLGPEVARANGTTRQSLAAAVRGRLKWMRQLLAEDRRDAVSDDDLIGTLACMLGGVILARALGSKDATVILSACRAFLHQRSSVKSDERRTSSARSPAAAVPAKRGSARRPARPTTTRRS
jgi:TetR/AcrR family transcriptional regulator, transcriptional repressor for nem operon